MKRTTFLIGLLLELIAIFGLFLPYQLLLARGVTITLETIPVDPRSLFRGDYITLDYQVGQDLPVTWGYDKPVYVILEPQGGVYKRVSFSEEKPAAQDRDRVCLRGVSEYQQARFPDIGQYFVEEGLGRELEQARNARRLLVDAVVDPVTCDAVLKGIRLGPEVPQAELDAWQNRFNLPPQEPVMETGTTTPL